MRFIYVVCLLLFAHIANAQEPNFIIKVHKVKLNNKNAIVERHGYTTHVLYKIKNKDTGDSAKIHQKGKVTSMYLEPGTYCFKTLNFNFQQYVGIANPLCFIVKPGVVNNAGTWVMGINYSSVNWFGLLKDMKNNYEELAREAGVENTVPVDVIMPEQAKD